ncbi:hypothetical protein HDU85_006658 [Gaertneriomyces sp. JEL0708]|nr:hypothetical protein HDU85_006658 [Gaertneriomyces sp. JEL0708]
MPLLGCAILPHNQMVLDPTIDGAPEGILEVHEGCKAVAQVIASWEPEIVCMLTPHGISAGKSPRPGIYLTPSATGNAAAEPPYNNYELAIQIDSQISEGFLNHLGNNGVACVKITGSESPLAASEIVPLWFLRSLQLLRKAPKYMLVSLPTPIGGTSIIRSETSKDRVPDLYQFGTHLQKYLAYLPLKSAIILSGDLSHTHATSCKTPLFLPNPAWKLPISDAAAVFDAIVEKWASTLNSDFLLRDAAALVKKAVSCAFDGLVVIQAVLDKEGVARFSKHVIARHRPSYVGMLACIFQVDKRVPYPDFTYTPPQYIQ